MSKIKRACVYKSDDGQTTTKRWGYKTSDGKMFISEDSKLVADKHQKSIDKVSLRNKVETFLINLCRKIL